MLYLEPESTDAAFHFSVEEYIMRDYPWDEPVMMLWQADKCAMLGSNQIAEAEIDISYAKNEDIQIIRRSSGGGTIFTDSGTFLFTVIQPYVKEQLDLEFIRKDVALHIVKALNKMGIPAKIEGRNDILADGKKISGLAQYACNGRICTHGSLLFNTDLDMLTQVLQADDEKIHSKALRSVRSRVTNIINYFAKPITTNEFCVLLKENLFSFLDIQEYMLSERDLTQINEIFQKKYGNPSWTHELSPKFSFYNSRRFAGGKVEVFLDIVKGVVSSCSIRGDFLGVMPIHDLEEIFEGLLFQYHAFSKALEGFSIHPYLGKITSNELLSVIFD